MSKMGKIAAVLAVSAAGVVFGSSGSAALAGSQQAIDALNANVSPSAPCEPQVTKIEDENKTINTISRRCSQTTQTTTSGGASENQEVVLSDRFSVDAGTTDTLRQECPKGKVVLGGGYELRNSIFNRGGNSDLIQDSRANASRTGWEVVISNPTQDDVELSVRAVCGDPS